MMRAGALAIATVLLLVTVTAAAPDFAALNVTPYDPPTLLIHGDVNWLVAVVGGGMAAVALWGERRFAWSPARTHAAVVYGAVAAFVALYDWQFVGEAPGVMTLIATRSALAAFCRSTHWICSPSFSNSPSS